MLRSAEPPPSSVAVDVPVDSTAVEGVRPVEVIVQGGAAGASCALMLKAGTNVVGGVNPRKAGRTVDFDERAVPVFGSVAEGIEVTGADVTVVFVPPAFAKAAVVEAADAVVEGETRARRRDRAWLGLRLERRRELDGQSLHERERPA